MKSLIYSIFIIYTLSSQSISLNETTDISYKGNIGIDQWIYENKSLKGQPNQHTRVYSSLDLLLQGDFDYQIRLNTRLLIDSENKELNRYEIDDFYIDYFSDSYEFRAGYQIFSWKTVESLSHADFLNQTDAEGDILDPDKFGELAIRFRYIPETETEQTIELYYLPYFRSTKLPTKLNRFGFDLIPQLSDDYVVNENDTYLFESDKKRWYPQFALRYQMMPFEGIDANIFFFHGYNRFPLLKQAGLTKYGENAFFQFYNLVSKMGLTFQGIIENWLIKGEMVHTSYNDYVRNGLGESIKPNFFAYTLGFEYTLYSALKSDQDLGVILEFIGDSDTGKKPEELAGFRPFQNHIFLGVRYAFNTISDRTILLGSFIDYKEENIISQIEYEERLFSSFKLKISYNYLAPTTAPLSEFKDNDRIKFNLSYHF